MPRYAANLDLLWPDRPLIERFGAAKEAEMGGVELSNPYEGDVQALRSQLLRHDLKMVMMACPPPNYTGGARGFAADPDRSDRFRRDFKRVQRYSTILKPEFIHILTGPDHAELGFGCLLDNLIWAASVASKQKLLISVDPESAIANFDMAQVLLDKVGATTLGLLLNTALAQQVTGDVTATWEAFGAHVSHVQIAESSTGQEPAAASCDHPAFLSNLDACGYRGWVSAAYIPEDMTDAGLDGRV